MVELLGVFIDFFAHETTALLILVPRQRPEFTS